jgi:leucyl aminopeptidase
MAATVRGLEQFETRYFSNANHRTVAGWIRDRFLSAGLQSTALDSFQYSQSWQYNVVGTIPGSIPGPEIVIGGHYDTNSSDILHAPGADDNGSGTSAVIEAARAVAASGYLPAATLRFVAFAAEEVGLRGGADYATKARTASRDIQAMINFDMIAHRLAGQADRDYYVVWYTGAESLASMDSLMARNYTTLTPIMTTSYRSGSDSYQFWGRNYPAVFNIERDFSPFYHSPNDRSDTLDFPYAAEILQAGLATLVRLDQTLKPQGGGTPLPSELALRQNFPNPFNGGTAIPYSVSVQRRVVLTIYDMLGREVERLVDADRPPGYYVAQWSAASVASGLFLCRLSDGERSESIRMVHIQ